MNSHIENEIDRSLAIKQTRDTDTARQNNTALVLQREFAFLRDSTIKPVMEDIVEYLARNKISSEIRKSRSFVGNNVGFAIDNAEASDSPGITIIFTMDYTGNETGKLHACSHFSIFPRYNYLIVHTHTVCQRGGFGGGFHKHESHNYKMTDITKDFIRTSIMKLLKATL